MAASIYCDRIESPLRDEIQSRDGLLTLVAIRYLLNAMRERLLVVPRPAVRTLTAAVDVVLLTPRDRTLAVLLLRAFDARSRDRWVLPWDAPRSEESPEQAALRVSRAVLGSAPAALEPPAGRLLARAAPRAG